MKAQGTVFKYGDNIDTDIIIPARYLNTSDSRELAAHCMEPVDEDFFKNVKEGDIMVGGFNFGCGSSREHAPIAIKECGVSCVIAKSFARIFYRNDIEAGDKVCVDFETGIIQNMTKNREYKAMPFPEFIDNIIKKGGLLNSIK